MVSCPLMRNAAMEEAATSWCPHAFFGRVRRVERRRGWMTLCRLAVVVVVVCASFIPSVDGRRADEVAGGTKGVRDAITHAVVVDVAVLGALHTVLQLRNVFAHSHCSNFVFVESSNADVVAS